MKFFKGFVKNKKDNLNGKGIGEIKNGGASVSRSEKNLPIFYRLRKDGNSYYITSKRDYSCNGTFKKSTVLKIFDFAYSMSFKGEGEHRHHRSGGDWERRQGEIFADTFQGKIAECAACNGLHELGYDTRPDFSVSRLGTWDTSDLSVNGKEIAVKSTKHFGNLLLLEQKDWNEKGEYIPNGEKGIYDFIIFVRIKPSCEDILKTVKAFYCDTVSYTELKNCIVEKEWEYDVVGFITKDDLCYIIKNDYILPKGSFLNGKQKMDADNYYVQSGDMRNINSLKEML